MLKTFHRWALVTCFLLVAFSFFRVSVWRWNVRVSENVIGTQSTEYFLDNSCANNGNGTASSCAGGAGGTGAWNTMTSVRGIGGNTCAAGDTIRVKVGSGPYINTSQGPGDPSEQGGNFITCTAGTTANPWRLTAFDQANKPQFANCALNSTTYSACDNPTFTALTAQNIELSYLKIFGGVWFSGIQTQVIANLRRGWTFHHNEFTRGWGEIDDGNWSTLFLQGCFGASVHHNLFSSISVMAGGGSQSSTAAIKLFTCTNSTYEFNTIDGVTAAGTQTGGIDDKQDAINNIHRFNYMINVPHGIRIQQQTNVNYPYQTTASGTVSEFNVIRVINSGNCLRLEAGGISDYTFRNNTCFGPFAGDAALTAFAGNTNGIRFYNNIIMGSVKHIQFYGGVTFTQMDYNFWDSAISSAFTFAGGNFTNLAAVVSGTAFEDHGQSMTSAQVLFVNSGGNNFQLQTNSPAQSACRTGGVVGGSAIDCGAFTDTASPCVGWLCGGGGPPPDTTDPVISILVPTSGTTFATAVSPIPTLSGTASDNTAVTQVTWNNNRGGGGVATGTTAWSQTNVVLQSGVNVLTVTAFDAAGNTTDDVLTVTYTPVTPPPSPGAGPLSGVRIR